MAIKVLHSFLAIVGLGSIYSPPTSCFFHPFTHGLSLGYSMLYSGYHYFNITVSFKFSMPPFYMIYSRTFSCPFLILSKSAIHKCGLVYGIFIILLYNNNSVVSDLYFICEKGFQHSLSYSLFLAKFSRILILNLSFGRHLSLSQCAFGFRC